MVLNICGLSRGVVCDQGEVELVGGAKYTLYESSCSETARQYTCMYMYTVCNKHMDTYSSSCLHIKKHIQKGLSVLLVSSDFDCT